jgi:hemerythrin-like domain-containing protein
MKMNAIDIMVEEHKNIKRVLKVIRNLCIRIVYGEEVNQEGFRMAIDFIRNYADKHHHNKEEEILFKKMSEELGDAIKNGPIFGMLSEHDLGRLFVKNLEQALDKVQNGEKDSRVDVIANAIAYTDLLHRHIDKEDNALYQFGAKNLSEEALKDVEKRCQEVESIAKKENLQDKYLKIVDELEKL